MLGGRSPRVPSHAEVSPASPPGLPGCTALARLHGVYPFFSEGKSTVESPRRGGEGLGNGW